MFQMFSVCRGMRRACSSQPGKAAAGESSGAAALVMCSALLSWDHRLASRVKEEGDGAQGSASRTPNDRRGMAGQRQ